LQLRSRNQPSIELNKQTTPDQSGLLSCLQPPDLPCARLSLARQGISVCRISDLTQGAARPSSIARRLSRLSEAREASNVCMFGFVTFRAWQVCRREAKQVLPPAPRRARTIHKAAQQTNIARAIGDRVRRSELRQRLGTLAKL
jgi:hypothetical protein